MWFHFPDGATNITIERQEFKVELKGPDGKGYFRAPNHFADRILGIKGFGLAHDLPEGAPEDLPLANPGQDNAVANLASRMDAQNMEIEGLRADLISSRAENQALMNENKILTASLEAANAKVTELEEELDNQPAQAPQTQAKGKAA